jgi:hypothetical protein
VPDGYDVAGARIGQVGRRTQIILIGTALTALTEEQNGRQNGGSRAFNTCVDRSVADRGQDPIRSGSVTSDIAARMGWPVALRSDWPTHLGGRDDIQAGVGCGSRK